MESMVAMEIYLCYKKSKVANEVNCYYGKSLVAIKTMIAMDSHW
jgi:hypothetical protein